MNTRLTIMILVIFFSTWSSHSEIDVNHGLDSFQNEKQLEDI